LIPQYVCSPLPNTSTQGDLPSKQNAFGADRQITPSLPREMTLLSSLVAARKRRANRTTLPGLSKPTILSFEKSLAGFPKGRTGFKKTTDAYSVLRSHLITLGQRALNDRQLRQLQPATQQDLVDALNEYAATYAEHLIRVRAPGEPSPSELEKWQSMEFDDLERCVDDTAEYLVDTWSPTWIMGKRNAGALGGLVSRRGPAWTDSDLTVLSLLTGQSVAQQAKFMKVSARTIARMRKALRERDATPQDL